MSITIPSFLTPVLWYYGLAHHWPGIDEDRIVDWGEQRLAQLEVTETFATELINLLGELGENTSTEIFVSIRDNVEDKKSSDLDPWLNLIKTGVPTATEAIHHAVTGYKTLILSILVSNIASDIPIIVSGVGLPLIAAKKAAMKILLDQALGEAKEEAIVRLVELGEKYIETYWLSDQKDKLKTSLAGKLTNLKGVEAGGTGEGGAVAVLTASTSDVMTCIYKLRKAVMDFKQATEEEQQDAKPDFQDDAIGGSDKVLPVAVEELLGWGVEQVTGFLMDLSLEILDLLTEMLLASDEKLNEAEKQCHADAVQLRKTLIALRPLSTPASDQAPPDFFAPVRASLGVGPADEHTGAPADLDEPVGEAKGTGPARATSPHDMSVLDVEVAEAKGAGAARSDAGGAQPRLDAGVSS